MRAPDSWRPVLLLTAVSLTSWAAAPQSPSRPLAIGETFTIDSKATGETRVINVYSPLGFAPAAAPLPVLYMPDGGMAEDFLHVAGLVQVLSGNGGMRPHLLVGIENTERRRDMTGPTTNAEDRKIAPRVGGSAAFRRFIRDELMPAVKARYRTTDDTAIVGESLAGLFVVETFVVEPDLFQTYIAIDPSVWWNDGGLVAAAARLDPATLTGRQLHVSNSREALTFSEARAFIDAVRRAAPAVSMYAVEYTDERHATVYHPAALRALRTVFAPRRP